MSLIDFIAECMVLQNWLVITNYDDDNIGSNKLSLLKRTVSHFDNLSYVELQSSKQNIQEKYDFCDEQPNVIHANNIDDMPKFLNILMLPDQPKHPNYKNGDKWNGHTVINGIWLQQ